MQHPSESDAADAQRVAREKAAAGPELARATTSVRNHFHTAWSEARRIEWQVKLKTSIRGITRQVADERKPGRGDPREIELGGDDPPPCHRPFVRPASQGKDCSALNPASPLPATSKSSQPAVLGGRSWLEGPKTPSVVKSRKSGLGVWKFVFYNNPAFTT